GADRKAHLLTPQGISAIKIDAAQNEVLWELIKEYVYRYREDAAREDLDRIYAAKPDSIFFAWAGGTERGEPHYYRVQGPTFLIEFDNTQNDANHVHSVWRDFANDFGDDLLKQHYEAVPHAK